MDIDLFNLFRLMLSGADISQQPDHGMTSSTFDALALYGANPDAIYWTNTPEYQAAVWDVQLIGVSDCAFTLGAP